MDEFKKPYEYDDEEKGVSGLILVYFIMLLVEESIQGFISILFGYNKMPHDRVLGMVVIVAGSLYVVFAVFSAIVLKLKNKHAIKVSKVFLIFRIVYLIPYLILYTIDLIGKIPYYKENDMYWVTYNSNITSFIIGISFAIVFSAGWYIYLVKSNKVRKMFPVSKAA